MLLLADFSQVRFDWCSSDLALGSLCQVCAELQCGAKTKHTWPDALPSALLNSLYELKLRSRVDENVTENLYGHHHFFFCFCFSAKALQGSFKVQVKRSTGVCFAESYYLPLNLQPDTADLTAVQTETQADF